MVDWILHGLCFAGFTWVLYSSYCYNRLLFPIRTITIALNLICNLKDFRLGKLTSRDDCIFIHASIIQFSFHQCFQDTPGPVLLFIFNIFTFFCIWRPTKGDHPPFALRGGRVCTNCLKHLHKYLRIYLNYIITTHFSSLINYLRCSHLNKWLKYASKLAAFKSARDI